MLSEYKFLIKNINLLVLILILLDHALRVSMFTDNDNRLKVLILILLDHALREEAELFKNAIVNSLNPYFIGPCSPRQTL